MSRWIMGADGDKLRGTAASFVRGTTEAVAEDDTIRYGTERHRRGWMAWDEPWLSPDPTMRGLRAGMKTGGQM